MLFRSIVRQAGGHISVYSEVGRGSSFKVYLPVMEQPATPDEGVSANPESLRGTETILLVEDEEAVRRMVRDVLQRHGYTVLEAENATEARLLHKRFGGQINLLLCDVALPQYDGRDLAREITAGRPGLQVLYMSGYTAAAVGGQERLIPGRNFLSKPFGPTALLIAIRHALTS